MQQKLEEVKQIFIARCYRCRNFKDLGFIANDVESTWKVWINYDGEIVWYTDSLFRLDIELEIRKILNETNLG